jgi:MYXO-CTERM domain-containing protein
MATLDLVVDADDDGFDADEDCDDTEPAVHPGATELCNGVDDDCDDEIDEGCPCDDGATRPCGSDVGECSPGTERCTAEQWGACEGETGPQPELCNGVDDDCDGEIDEQCGSGSGGAAASPDEDADSGCGCRSHPQRSSGALWSLLAVLGAGRARRRR